MAPLLDADALPKLAGTLNPVFEIEGSSVVILSQAMAAAPARMLRTPVANLGHQAHEITAAMDLLFQGF